ncbi:ABC transporter permease [Pedobacter quisquiliarum]|uniref:ABC transporter permease n=1 Tax=Pedobacter quisquiliarum TaxID=1834438 RepID=A0A916XEL3_9SPHI|nr:ABC transporter permease [Pedobacter quisquiliarum]GGC68233.1 ABC transporter permease [Pedobacter quisquiliarum]
MFKLNLKIALRTLWKNKSYTLINAGGLAIGLASCMILLLYVAHEWGYDKQFSGYEKTYVVYNNSKNNAETLSWAWTPTLMAGEVREKIAGVKYASHSTYPNPHLISYKQNNFKAPAVFADQAFLKILDYEILSGNAEQALTGVNTVILTETLAEKLFGQEDPINKVVKFNNEEVLKVSAVIADVPVNSSIQFEYLLPWALFEKINPWVKNSGWGNNSCLTLLQLQDEGQLSAVSAQMRDIYKRNIPDATNEVVLQPLAKWHLYDHFENGKSVGGRIDQLKIFFLLAFCILLIACVNFMNLSTARSEKRAREVGVRKAVGSSRAALMNQFLQESFLLAFIGMLTAFMLMEIALPFFNSLLNTSLKINYTDWRFWVALVGLTLATGFIAGIYPAFYLSSFEPVKVLKGFGHSGAATLSIRKALVVFQFVFAACLIVCTAVIYQQLQYIKDKPIGFNKNGLIEIPMEGNLRSKEKMALLKTQLLESGAVTGVTYFSRSLNEGGNNTFSVSWPGKNPNDQVLFNFRSAGASFSKTIGAEMIAGEEFSEAHHNDSTHMILNEAAVARMGLKHPVGATFSWGGSPVTVIGVIKDFVVESPYQAPAPMILYHIEDEFEYMIARMNPEGNVSSSVNKIDEIVKAINPNYPVERKFADDNFEQKFQNEQLLGTIANLFGGFAIFISSLGLLGLALFMAEQRKKEISIRKVLGASTMNILTLLNKDFIKLVAIANVIAFPLAYIISSNWLSAYEYRIQISLLPFGIAVLLSLIIAVLTVSLQSFKVAKANPIDALKYE